MVSGGASTPESDSDIIRRSRSDPEAFGEIYARHGQTIAEFVARRVPADRADDIVALVFVTAFRRRRRYDRARGVCLPWLYGIARNTLRNEYRRWQVEKRQTALHAAALPSIELDPADAIVDRMEATELVNNMATDIARLPDQQRQTLLLFADGYSYQQIAAQMNCEVGTVRSRISRARFALRRAR